MPEIIGTPPILDSSGRLASGFLRFRVSRPFNVPGGHVTKALAVAQVRRGVPLTAAGHPLTLPVTPDGVTLDIEQDLDGDDIERFTVTVPDVPTLTYSELLFNRGQQGAGPEPWMWDLTGGADFPPQALIGDWGIDTDTLELFRNGA